MTQSSSYLQDQSKRQWHQPFKTISSEQQLSKEAHSRLYVLDKKGQVITNDLERGPYGLIRVCALMSLSPTMEKALVLSHMEYNGCLTAVVATKGAWLPTIWNPHCHRVDEERYLACCPQPILSLLSNNYYFLSKWHKL